MRAILVLLAVLFGSPDHATRAPVSPDTETGTIAGTVTDATTGAALVSARIFLPGQSVSTLTNRAGRFVLTNVPAGSHTLRVELIGYEALERTVTVTSGETTELQIQLNSTGLQLQELVVTGALAEDAAVQYRASIMPSAEAETARIRQGLGRDDMSREGYAHIEENRFTSVHTRPQSTFAIDVDRASYANVRRFLDSGTLPPKHAVRIEEMVNYFEYDYPQPRGEHPFSVVAEAGPAPWHPEHQLVRIGVQGFAIDTGDLPPSNLVFLLDVSGSMRGSDRLPLLKSAFHLLVNQLGPEDRVAIVAYAGAAGLVLESTPGDRKGEILEALERLQAGGSTAGGAGLRLAYDVVRENFMPDGNNRVILATDGDFNVGESSDAAMIELIEEKREEGAFLTVLGFGRGNLQDAKMEQIADHGNGNFAYIDSLREAEKVLVREMGGTLHTIAKDVKIQVEFNPTRVAAYRLIGYENRLLAAEDFDDDTKDAGELGAGHSVTALYEVVPVGVDSELTTRDLPDLRYQQGPDRALDPIAAGPELMFVKLRYKQPDGETSRLIERPVVHRQGTLSEDFRFAAAVASFGMVLRESEYAGGATFEDVLRWARNAQGTDPDGDRSEFVDLVEKALVLDGRTETVARRDAGQP